MIKTIGTDGPLKIELLEGGKEGRVHESFRTHILNKLITVPMGFVTNFASVPRFFWRLFPPQGEYSEAATVHDYLYQSGIFDKETADLIFKAAMKKAGVPAWKYVLMYQAVKILGTSAWSACRKEELKVGDPNVGGPGKK